MLCSDPEINLSRSDIQITIQYWPFQKNYVFSPFNHSPKADDTCRVHSKPLLQVKSGQSAMRATAQLEQRSNRWMHIVPPIPREFWCSTPHRPPVREKGEEASPDRRGQPSPPKTQDRGCRPRCDFYWPSLLPRSARPSSSLVFITRVTNDSISTGKK